jgi:hypothetical protein
LVKPIALLKVQILIFGAIAGITLLVFAHFETVPHLKYSLTYSAVLAFFAAGGFYCLCAVKGWAGNSLEKAVAEEGAKIVQTHRQQIDSKPSRKRRSGSSDPL